MSAPFINTESAGKSPLNGKKTKEERRISNRQKLLALKRHSGFLKRPEILETVYSVEEDGDAQQQQQQPQPQPPQPQHQNKGGRSSPVRIGSSSSAPVVILTAFRYVKIGLFLTLQIVLRDLSSYLVVVRGHQRYKNSLEIAVFRLFIHNLT